MSLVPLVLAVASAALQSRAEAAPVSPYARWELGPPVDPAFFPIGVWLQDPRLAQRYRRLGVNTYVGLWEGPTEEQLAALAAAGMRVVCEQNAVALAHADDPTIVAWMLPDEPDNRETKPGGETGARMTPAEVAALAERVRARDPRRPVWLNLGQGVANDDFRGRGARPSDYPGYAAACDILSFDVYPVANLGRDDGADLLWYQAKGLARLRRAGGADKILWSFLECTSIHESSRKATPEQVRAEAWISLVHGSRGLVWFVHSFAPEKDSAAVFRDPAMLAMVRRVNEEVAGYAPLLNAPDEPGVAVHSTTPDIPVAALAKRQGDELTVFAVGMRNAPAEAVFRWRGARAAGDEHGTEGSAATGEQDAALEPEGVTVLGEERSLPLEGGVWRDRFAPWEVHVYRLRGAR